MPALATDVLTATTRDAFHNAFGAEPTHLGLAPSRVELLGNHTDYHGGLVMSAAIDRHTVVVGRAVPGRSARVLALNFNEIDTFDVDALEQSAPGSWSRYARGVCWALSQATGPLTSGFEAAILGDVPLGAGLSSSASLQAALGVFLLASGAVADQPPIAGWNDPDESQADPARMALAQTLRRSENEFVGVGSGLLDQFSVLFGRENMALSLDCRSLEHARLPLGNPAPAIVVCDSKTSRRLADGMYDRRREEGERVLRYFQKRPKGKGAAFELLRDVTPTMLRDHWDELNPVGRRRARHVLGENDRVRQGAEALRKGDVARLGKLMRESHTSSRVDFENSAPALDALMAAAAHAPGFLGGKLSGAGWAGCTVNLVAPDQAEAFAEAVKHAYEQATRTIPEIHICHAANGATARRLP